MKGKYYEECTAQYKKGDAGAPDGTTNSSVYTYKEPNIVEGIKFKRLGWAGHTVRMEEQRIAKRVLYRNFLIMRPVGRPGTRWTDVVQRDARQLLGIRVWRKKAANRDEWRRLVREAKAPKGL